MAYILYRVQWMGAGIIASWLDMWKSAPWAYLHAVVCAYARMYATLVQRVES